MSREGFNVSLSTIKKVDGGTEGWHITKEDGWSFYYPLSEAPDFVPKVGDWVVLSEAVNNIAGIVIEGRVIRNKTKEQVKADHEQWKKNYELTRLKRYVEHGDELKARVEKLPEPLKQRMYRFAEKDGRDFWIDSADYEMAALEGAAALIRKAKYVFPEPREWAEDDYASDKEVEELTQLRVKWVEDWWALNTAEHGYNYKKQMEIVPDFGEGHSGNTAGAAYGLALRVLRGEEV